MNSGPSLVGLVASVRIQAALLLPVSLVSCVPAYLGGAARLDLTTSVGVGALLFVVSFWALLTGRRSWYRTRLEQVTAPPFAATVIPRDQAFELFSRTLTTPLLLVLAIGLALAYATGAPAGMLLAGFACAMLWQARWLTIEEKKLGGWVVCPHTPVRVHPDDPNGPVYRQAPFYLVRADA